MFTLSVKFKKQPIKTYVFEDIQTIRIGRKNDNDIVLQDMTVSGYHARIEPKSNAFLLMDLHSKNGTFVNESFINSYWLNEGDIITVGDYTITFSLQSEVKQDRNIPQESVDQESPMEKTAILDTRKHKDMRAKSFLEAALGQKSAPKSLSLLFISGGHGRIKLTKKMTTIGKDLNADLFIRGVLIGKIAATITRRPNGYYLSATGGFLRPKVNGNTVKKSVILKEGDIIEIGAAKLRLIQRNAT
jgi:pSer/pThr/pTyr-binding forkhead associated (FHA) protein